MNKKYQIILADPPWRYKVWSRKGLGRSAESHYKTMAKEDIQNLRINKIADDNCVLLLWVTPPCLLEGVELIEKWGFKYKTIGFTWIKKNKKANSLFWGMGYYTRANTELCLLATKGKPLKRISRSVHQVIETKIREHSQKPDEVRKKIVELFGNIPRIELFARQKTEGWDSIGYDIDGMDIKDSIELLVQKNTLKRRKRYAETQRIEVKKLKLEKKNFRVNSENWDEIIVDEEKYLVNPEKDIWEIAQGEYKGEQLFTYDAAMRETKKVGKRMPTDKEFSTIWKDDIPNITYVGYRYTSGSFSNRGTYTNLWSSTESGPSAWSRSLLSGYSPVLRYTSDKAYGFSVRCVK